MGAMRGVESMRRREKKKENGCLLIIIIIGMCVVNSEVETAITYVMHRGTSATVRKTTNTIYIASIVNSDNASAIK